MSTVSATPDRPGPVLDDAFVELVYADDQLLAAEFEAIIAESWSASPPTETADAGVCASRNGHRLPACSPQPGPHAPQNLGNAQPSRQRSPPRLDPAAPQNADPTTVTDRK